MRSSSAPGHRRAALLFFLALCLALAGCRRARELGEGAGKAGRLADAFSCAEGDRDACKRHEAEVRAACDREEGDGCVLLGIIHQTGRIVPKDPARAVALFEKACTLGDGAGCWYFGTAVERGDGRPKDPAAARVAYDKGCAMGNVNACYDAGVVREHGRGGAKDRAGARESYRRACTLSKRADGLGCSRAKELE